MKKEISENDFINEFREMGRLTEGDEKGNFTIKGLRALYEYILELEDDIGEEQTIDVIALCCEFSEYENYEELFTDFDYLIDGEDFWSEEEQQHTLLEELNDRTTVIIIDKDEGHMIIGQF